MITESKYSQYLDDLLSVTRTGMEWHGCSSYLIQTIMLSINLRMKVQNPNLKSENVIGIDNTIDEAIKQLYPQDFIDYFFDRYSSVNGAKTRTSYITDMHNIT